MAIVIEGSQILFSGSVWTQLLTALVVGLLVAFALQFLLTSLGVAVGLSVLAVRGSADRSQASSSSEDAALGQAAETAIEPEAKPSESAAQLGFWAGFSVLLTVDTVLFAACFLAARFSQAQSPLTGAIEGIVIWSAYLLILIWLSSLAVSSVVGSLLGVTIGGFRQMMRPIGAMFSASEPEAVTATEMRETVRQEVQSAFDPEQLQTLIRQELQEFSAIAAPVLQNQEDSASPQTSATGQSRTTQAKIAVLQQQIVQLLIGTPSEKLTAKRVDRRLRRMLEAAQFDISETALIPEIDQSIVMRLLMQREDLSDKQREKIANRIEIIWNEFRQLHQAVNGNQIAQVAGNSSVTNGNSKVQELTSTVLETLATQIPNFPLDETEIDRAVQQLPELLHQVGKQLPTGASLAMLAMALSRGKDLLPDSDALQSVKHTLEQAIEQSGMADLNHAVVEQVDQLRDRVRDQSLHQIEQVQQTVQQTVQQQVDRLKSETTQQLQATRHTATIAAWWLFFTVSTGAISAAVAGAVANLI